MEEDVRVELPRAQGGSSTQTRTPTATVPPRVPTPSASTAQRSVAPTKSVDGQESRNVALPPGTSSPRPRQSPGIYIDVRSSSPASPIAAAKLTAPKSPVWKVDPVDHAGSHRVSVGSTSSEAQTLSSGIQPASAAHKCPPAPRDTIDPDVRRYLESLGFEPEVYASKLEIIGLKNGAVINAIKNFVPESRKDKLEEDLQNLAGLTVGESMALISGLRRSA
ncbi:hypothetical protein EVJ58_g546 [Rhodofomes roseus]|uniref:Uncharacterized protein n=1 Tax=Rhodofomes roseus TaxID=34475 RepID=A0A4Y9Z3L1_9APHY|nr:hypothetical protein EVJ58_g546 [Rhodofomes roseus]